MKQPLVFGFLVMAAFATLPSGTARAQIGGFRADWLYLNRSDQTNADYEFDSGFRLQLSLGTELFDVELPCSQLDTWGDRQQRKDTR